MVDRGIEVILNSTIWTKNSHSGAYDSMKERLGLDPEDSQDIGMIINTSMSPWLRAQRTYKRLGIIIRNELYNAHGAVYDEPTFLNFVSPSIVGLDKNGGDMTWNGSAFVELEVNGKIFRTNCQNVEYILCRPHSQTQACSITSSPRLCFPRRIYRG